MLATRGSSARSSEVNGVAIAAAMIKILLEEATNNAEAARVLSNATRPIIQRSTAESLTEGEAKKTSAYLEGHMFAVLNVFREDLKSIENEEYALPYDMNPLTTPNFQRNPLEIWKLSRDNLRDQREKVQPRRKRNGGQELHETFLIDEKRYPSYYAQNFHYQSDGWFSKESADLYDFQVETLFLGSADAMRRRALPYLNRYLKKRKNAKLLDVACGTGRFLTFVRQNNPDLECTAMDLSPFYLGKTRTNHKAFDEKSGKKLKLLEANAEDLHSIEDESFDVITCVYLFHELPLFAQKNVVREMARVLKTNGKIFFVDSCQVGDGKKMKKDIESEINQALETFPQFRHEPYYRAYSELDLKQLFFENGVLECEVEDISWVSKMFVFTKPGSGSGAAKLSEFEEKPSEDEEELVWVGEKLT